MSYESIQALINAHFDDPFGTPESIDSCGAMPINFGSGEILFTSYRDVIAALQNPYLKRGSGSSASGDASHASDTWAVHMAGINHLKSREQFKVVSQIIDNQKLLFNIAQRLILKPYEYNVDIRSIIVEPALELLIASIFGLKPDHCSEIRYQMDRIDPAFSTWSPSTKTLNEAREARSIIVQILKLASSRSAYDELLLSSAIVDVIYGARHVISSVITNCLFLERNANNRIKSPLFYSNDYIRCLIKEACRILSPTIIITRDCISDCEIGNTTLHKGNKVVCYIPSALNSSQVFNNPTQFNPMRTNPAPYLTFGSGPHRCPFINFTLNTTATLLRLLKSSDITLDVPDRPRWRRSTNSFGVASIGIMGG